MARRKKDFTLKSTISLTDQAIKDVKVLDWKNAILHVEGVVQQYIKNDGVRPKIANVVIPLDEDSSSSSVSSSDEM